MKRRVLLALTLTLLLATLSFGQGPSYPYTVSLTFTSSTSSITGYNMYRALYITGCGTFTKLNATPFAATSYTDVNPPEGTYCYEVTAVNGTSESGPDLMPGQIIIPPVPPTGLEAELADNNQQIKFTWEQSVSASVIYNQIFCETPTGALGYKVIYTSPKPVTTLTARLNEKLSPGIYLCGVTATGKAPYPSGLSNIVSINLPKAAIQ